jgi:hypothetical protein
MPTCSGTRLELGGGSSQVSLSKVARDVRHLGELAWQTHSSKIGFVDGLGYHLLALIKTST